MINRYLRSNHRSLIQKQWYTPTASASTGNNKSSSSTSPSFFESVFASVFRSKNKTNKSPNRNGTEIATATRSKNRIMDIEPVGGDRTTNTDRLPIWLEKYEDEFPQSTEVDRAKRSFEAGRRIFNIAVERVLEPRTVKLVVVSAGVVMGFGAAEGTLLAAQIPFYESFETGVFVVRYSLENVLPSCIWNTADANLVVTALGYSPNDILVQFDPTSQADASTQLKVHLLASSRSIVAGFMLLAQLVRAVNISANAARIYEERIRLGQEPPLLEGVDQRVVRLCGRESDVTAVSLQRYGIHIFPVYESPEHVSHLVTEYSDNGRSPVFWSVRPGYYGYGFSWDNFPVDEDCFIHSSTGRNILCLEADATNSDDPLSLGDEALDLTIDDASQGFRRIQDLYKDGREKGIVPPFRTLKVYLGNSLEESKSGGGYSYTLRHRVRYAKEVDVLIDSKAPVLQQILRWCHRVAGKDRRVLLQTSSRIYFLNLQLLMRRYGFELYDPLDLRMLDEIKKGTTPTKTNGNITEVEEEEEEDSETILTKTKSLMQVLLDEQVISNLNDQENKNDQKNDQKNENEEVQSKEESLRRIPSAKALSRMPRLVYYETTMETVNAVQALVNAGEVEAANCCALLDKNEGMRFLDSVLNRKVGLIERRQKEQTLRELGEELVNLEYEEMYAISINNEGRKNKAKKSINILQKKKNNLENSLKEEKSNDKSDNTSSSGGGSGSGNSNESNSGNGSGNNRTKESSGLHIICSSLIYDDLFRQVRQWARMGFSGSAIQKELDVRFQDIIQQSIEVRDTVAEVAEEEEEKGGGTVDEEQAMAKAVENEKNELEDCSIDTNCDENGGDRKSNGNITKSPKKGE
jgi:hypothetical protein